MSLCQILSFNHRGHKMCSSSHDYRYRALQVSVIDETKENNSLDEVPRTTRDTTIIKVVSWQSDLHGLLACSLYRNTKAIEPIESWLPEIEAEHSLYLCRPAGMQLQDNNCCSMTKPLFATFVTFDRLSVGRTWETIQQRSSSILSTIIFSWNIFLDNV